MAKHKELTPEQYGKLAGFCTSNVTHHLRANNLSALPGVVSVRNFGRFYLLKVNEKLAKKQEKPAGLPKLSS